MQIEQIRWSAQSGWGLSPGHVQSADLVLVFSDNNFFQSEACYSRMVSKSTEASWPKV